MFKLKFYHNQVQGRDAVVEICDTISITPKTQTVASSDRALEQFDLHYKPVYGKLWPAMRIALLTQKKTCAIINKFCQEHSFKTDFVSEGGYDIVQKAMLRQQNLNQSLSNSQEFISTERSQIQNITSHLDNFEGQNVTNSYNLESMQNNDEDVKGYIFNASEDDHKDIDRTNLDNFVPAKMIYSVSKQNKLMEGLHSVYTPKDVKVDIVKAQTVTLPKYLAVMAFPGGNVRTFPEPKLDVPNGHLCYFMMDAASILPVIALDLKKGDSVLDICAAPGVKSMCMMQTRLPGRITCNDVSQSRILRLRNIFKFYLPNKHSKNITVTTKPGTSYSEPIFDKVLVDVPCTTDRHMLLVDDNNLFSSRRLNDRLEMSTLQKDLLVAGIKSCRPGGCVVYSTCTLSPVQNDGVIQDALDDLWKNTNVDVVVEDLNEIPQLFKDSFKFHYKCRFGQLVIPSLTLNYGPVYFCRIRRTS